MQEARVQSLGQEDPLAEDMAQNDGKTMETVSDFILGGSKITADGDCSHEINRRLLLGRQAMTNLLPLSRFSLV